MMKIRWIFLFAVSVCSVQAKARSAVVIDAQSIGEAPAKTDANAPAQSDAQTETNDANKEQVLKGGKMSPRERAALARAQMADSNKQTGDNFLAANKAKPGVVTLPSGVQYKILRAGKGMKPTEDNFVRCRYKGTLIDGSIIDKSDEQEASLDARRWLSGGLERSGRADANRLKMGNRHSSATCLWCIWKSWRRSQRSIDLRNGNTWG